MREIVEIPAEEILPDRGAVLTQLGMPQGPPSPRNQEMLRTAYEIFASHAAPEAVVAEISPEEFVSIYRGEDRNEPITPLAQVFPRADRLALFALTVGEAVSCEILRCFGSREFALGSMLDAIASAATERAGDRIEGRFRETLGWHRIGGPRIGVLRYSPGYCGWHISGQRRLFAALRPEEIGISLRESYLMQPLKSMSGVVVAGAREIHAFEDSFPFCRECRARGCRARILRVMEHD
jgi:hypothetical protein